MLKLDRNYFSNKFIIAVWLLMSFQAGYVNVGGFYTSGNFVSHVTGTSSMIGMNISNFNWMLLLTFVIILLAFIFGASFAGHYIGRYKDEGREPRYTFVLLIKAIMFGFVFILSGIEWTHDLDPMIHPVNLMTIFFLSFCCGVQNSTCSIATDGFLKPTHMTGLSTDIGINLTRIWAQKDKAIRDELFRKNILRISILLAFIFGGVISGIIFSKFEHYAFFFPFLSSLCFLMIGWSRDAIQTNQSNIGFKFAKASLGLTFATTLGLTFLG